MLCRAQPQPRNSHCKRHGTNANLLPSGSHRHCDKVKLFLLFLSLQGRNPTPTKLIYSSDEGNKQKWKRVGKTNLTLWHLWHTDKNAKWQEVLFLKGIILLLSDCTSVSCNPQQLSGSASSPARQRTASARPADSAHLEQGAGLPPKSTTTTHASLGRKNL